MSEYFDNLLMKFAGAYLDLKRAGDENTEHFMRATDVFDHYREVILERVATLTRKRDEARAEVERLATMAVRHIATTSGEPGDIRDAQEFGAAEERARNVAWLRRRSRFFGTLRAIGAEYVSKGLADAADCIERGEREKKDGW